MVVLYLSGFWFSMLASQVAFKLAYQHPAHRWTIFLAGALVGISGTWFIMALHGKMPAHLVVGLCVGGGFVLSQFAMSAMERRFNPVAILGSLIVVAGILLIAYAGSPAGTPTVSQPG